MKTPLSPIQAAMNTLPPENTDRPLRGRWLLFAQGGWVVIALLSLILYAASIPTFLAFVSVPCTGDLATCRNNGQTTPEDIHILESMGLSKEFFVTSKMTLYIAFVVIFVLIGLFIFWRKSDDRMAILSSGTLIAFPGSFNSTLLQILSPPFLLIDQIIAFIGGISLFLFFYLFPSGRFVPRWTLWPGIGLIGFWGLYAFFPFSYFHSLPFFSSLLLGFIATVLIAQAYRYRRVSSVFQRQQTRWVVFGVSIGLSCFLILGILSTFFPSLIPQDSLTSLLSDAAYYLSLLFIPISIGIAILRSRLFDIDLIINRTLVYGILTASVICLYVLIVGGLSVLFQIHSNLFISLLATGLVAVLFQPLRNRLQSAVNRLTYGDRNDPYRIISRLGERLEATLIPDAILPTVVETVAQALKLPYVAIELPEGAQFRLAAFYGTATSPALRIPLLYQQETVGRLLLASRSPGESFTSIDRRLLDDLARQAGIAAHTVRLTSDLQQARERLLLAQEEERRRLARELHDSVSQALYGISLGAHSARIALEQDPDQLAEALDYVLSLAEAALTEMRALIFELRPESLETEGLVSALNKQAAALHARHNLIVSTSLCNEPDLQPEAKQDLYRIVQEALHNTVKHARASKINLHLKQTPEEVVLEIYDDGVGFDVTSSFPGHLGLRSMRERVTSLGGRFEIESEPGIGTRICVRIPGS